MKGASVGMTPPQIDITAPEGDITIEVDAPRGVMYVHIEGYSCLRICQIKGTVILEGKNKNSSTTAYVHHVGDK